MSTLALNNMHELSLSELDLVSGGRKIGESGAIVGAVIGTMRPRPTISVTAGPCRPGRPCIDDRRPGR